MAAGTAIITAVGAALGATQGGLIANSYFGQIEGFNIRQIRSGHKHGIIIINGFLSENKSDTEDWELALKENFLDKAWYHLDWEAKRLRDLGTMASQSFSKLKLMSVKAAAEQATKLAGRKMAPGAALSVVGDLLGNPWHVAMYRAQQTGILLAEAISRTPDWTFTLAGHSLGARVIFYALEALATRTEQPIQDVYLLGGAVDRSDVEGWERATKPITGKIYNCYSKNDSVLSTIYRTANGFMSDPIGYERIPSHPRKIENINCSDFVLGHLEWKPAYSTILSKLKELQ